MAPKKATSTTKKSAPTAAHGSYKDMIKDAIINLKDRTGSSRQAIKKYVRSNNALGGVTDAAFNNHINSALLNGEKSGDFERPKGPSGPVKLAKKGEKPAAAKPAAPKKTTTAAPKTATTKKPAAKKTTTATKKAPAAKKTATKANVGKKAAPKKPAAAPAVVDEKPTVLGKTKSGRVTKSKAPSAGTKKAIAPKKSAPKKAAPKKSATPKKTEA